MESADGQIRGTVFDIKRFALHDGPGIRVTLHLKGCPLSCLWCHNPEGRAPGPQLLLRPDCCIACGLCLDVCTHHAISGKNSIYTDMQRCTGCGACAAVCPANAREICGAEMSAHDAVKAVLADEAFFYSDDPAQRGGVTLSGGEPLEQPEFCMALLRLLGQYHIHRALDTSGYVPEPLICAAAEYCDLFLYDLKFMDTEQHRKYIGFGNEQILSNLKKLSELGSSIQIRVPFIPGLNDDDENIGAAAEFTACLNGISGVNILPYHKASMDKYRRWGWEYLLKDIREPAEAELRHAAELFEQKGISVQIGG